ncbi:MAG: hypothetical protein ABH839_00105 [Chloroflexota bacterium]
MDRKEYRELFLFAAKSGSLEGYLFERSEVEPLVGWVDNIDRMYRDLSPAARQEIAPVLAPVLEKILEYGERSLEPGLKGKVKGILSASATG